LLRTFCCAVLCVVRSLHVCVDGPRSFYLALPPPSSRDTSQALLVMMVVVGRSTDRSLCGGDLSAVLIIVLLLLFSFSFSLALSYLPLYGTRTDFVCYSYLSETHVAVVCARACTSHIAG